jgi:SWIB/MDM2 domain/Plus-3 domain
MCYTCTYSSCRRCLKNAKFFRVRGSKGFCDTCFGTIILIEDNNQEKKVILIFLYVLLNLYLSKPQLRRLYVTYIFVQVAVDFDDKNSWEYLFKLYWVELKENLSLTIEELKNAKERWDPSVISSSRTESTDDSYDAYSDLDASSDGSSGRHKRSRGKKRGRKSTKSSTPDSGRPAQKAQTTQKAQLAHDLTPSKDMEIHVTPFPEGTEWATPDMLDFVGHMRDGNRSYVSQYDVQALVLDYIKKNNLRDPRKKSQIICDHRLLCLFGKPRVGHFEMLKLIEMHFLVKETPQAIANDGNNLNLGQVENGEPGGVMKKSVPDRKRKRKKFPEMSVNVNVGDYAAIDMHNICLVYLRRGLMEELIDDVEKFKEKVVGVFVRIRIPGVVQKQDMYRLVKVVGKIFLREPTE